MSECTEGHVRTGTCVDFSNKLDKYKKQTDYIWGLQLILIFYSIVMNKLWDSKADWGFKWLNK